MEIIYSPLNQFFIFLCFWFVIYIRRWRDSRYIMVMGVYTFSLWLMIASILGVSVHIPWNYYFHLVGMLIVGYTICLLSHMASEKWGEPYVREGGMVIYIPALMMPAVLIPSAAIKYIIQLL